jgi:hypothetical protein
MTRPATLTAVEDACTTLLAERRPVTFSTVAGQAGISRASLYRDPALRAVVEEHRNKSHDPRTLTGLSTEVSHLRTAVESLSQRVKHHEERLRRLERQPAATTKQRKEHTTS